MITIKNIQFNNISLERQEDGFKVTGSYNLMSDKRKVIAKQGFNGYGDLKIDISKDTKLALDEFVYNLQCDIEMETGINEAIKELKDK